MTHQNTVEEFVIDIIGKTHACDLDEVTQLCTDFTWNQVFLAVDRLSRRGEIKLVPTGRCLDTLTFPQEHEAQPDQRSHLNHKEVCHV